MPTEYYEPDSMLFRTWNNLTGQASCTNASAGYYVDVNGSISQTPCDAGTYNPINGSNSSADCIDVPAGNYSIPGSHSPIPCLEGTWQNQTGQTGCMNASAGYYVDVNGSTTRHVRSWDVEQPDRAGQLRTRARDTTWTNGSTTQTLRRSTYNPTTGSNSSMTCLTTPAGNYLGSGASSPIQCSVGTWQNQRPAHA